MKKKIISILLTLALCLTMLPVTALAAGTDLDLQEAAGNLSGAGYEWNAETNTLTLTDADLGTVTFPSNSSDRTIIINVTGNCSIEAMTFSSLYYTTWIVNGTGTLTASAFWNLTNVKAVTIEAGAALVGPNGLSFGTSGGADGDLTVNGSLKARNGHDLPSAVVFCSKAVIGPRGTLDVAGNGGVEVTSKFEIQAGGKFTANCTEYNLYVGLERSPIPHDGDGKQIAIVFPEGYLQSGWEVVEMDSPNKEYHGVTIAKVGREGNPAIEDSSMLTPVGTNGSMSIDPANVGDGSGDTDSGSETPSGGSSSGHYSYYYYTMLEGAGQNWTPAKSSGATFRSGGGFDVFSGVRVDGKLLDKADYTAKEGSTVVTLKPSFLKALAEGSHSITILFTDGESSADFTVGGTGTGIENPETGDNSFVAAAAAAAVFAVIGMAAFGRKK